MNFQRLPLLILLVLLLTNAAAANAAEDFLLRHPIDGAGRVASGHGMTVLTKQELKLTAQIVPTGNLSPSGLKVRFVEVSPQEKTLGTAVVSGDGIAELIYRADKREKPVTIVANIVGSDVESSRIVYHLPVRKPTWVMFMIFGLLGGLGLFLFGMEMMSSSMQRSAGGKMRSILGALTHNRFVGVAVGAFVTMVIQSSSATTVMLVSFVQAQLITFARTLGVILGADIGTTITAQLIAFKLTDYALLMIALGFGLKLLSRRDNLRNIGDVLLGFGLLFYGMHVMSSAMHPLRTYTPFLNLLTELENPIFGILVGTAFTALIQSSSAFTGIIIVLAQQGFLTLEAGIPLIFGANIGTCITAALASINAGRDAKRVALAHTMFKIIGVVAAIAFIPMLAKFVQNISPGGIIDTNDQVALARFIPRQIANAHTVFNVSLTLIFLPFTGLFAKLIMRMLPDRVEDETVRYDTRFLEPSLLSTPVLALNLAKVEIIKMGELVKEMAVKSIEPFFTGDLSELDELHEMEDRVDALDEQISAYLIDIGKQEINETQTDEVYLMMHVTKQYEQIADIVDKELRPLAQNKAAQAAHFSAAGASEVREYHIKMIKQIARSIDSFTNDSLEKAVRMTKKQAKYVALEGDLRQHHFERLRENVQESVTSSEIHLDLMDCMRKMNSYSANVARALVQRYGEKSEPKETVGDHD
ncbi:MAG: Na/Pi cotransporter family protein [Candidatus Krumholzibacteria bacterium]|nr:Na/Pi cotransporter family protein [Candidatus Krumholzibacteria bacterium]